MNIERAKGIKLSQDWEEVCKEIEFWIQGELQSTITCTPEELPAIQAKIKAYQEVKNLPDIVIDREE